MAPTSHEVTQMLLDWSNGDRGALDRLMPNVYNELRRLARSYLRRERPDHTLETAALVHEAYLRLIDQKRVSWQNRAHFFGVAAQSMRRILVDHARAHDAAKRGGGAYKIDIENAFQLPGQKNVDLVALDEALSRLEQLDGQQSRIVELRFFGGLSIEETAEAIGISPATVKRDWTMAKAWLHRQISRSNR
jgi:RNA polymerase sigma factor (TIGR02999 family)